MENLTELFPEVEPYNTGMLPVSDIHTIYFEESGNQKGIPVVHLHGGPGAASTPKNRQSYNPDKYRIIIYHQRACGFSTPQGELTENTTQHLIEDMEKLRKHLGIEKWVVSGRSWGSTLGILYAQNYPERVMALFIGGVFLATQQEARWMHSENGAASFFPDLYADYRDYIPTDEQSNLAKAYLTRVTNGNVESQIEATLSHMVWEGGLLKMEYRLKEEEAEKEREKLENPPAEEAEEAEDYSFLITLSKLLNYYAVNHHFLEDGAIAKNFHKLKGIPGIIIQGRYDMFCPVKTAWDLHKNWPESELIIIPDGGHSSSEPPTQEAILKATEKIADWFAK